MIRPIYSRERGTDDREKERGMKGSDEQNCREFFARLRPGHLLESSK
jgi:hypothetical protein